LCVRTAILQRLAMFAASTEIDSYRPADRSANVGHLTDALNRAMEAAIECFDFNKADSAGMESQLVILADL